MSGEEHSLCSRLNLFVLTGWLSQIVVTNRHETDLKGAVGVLQQVVWLVRPGMKKKVSGEGAKSVEWLRNGLPARVNTI